MTNQPRKRRVMTKARLDEISLVDRPAQADAKIVLRKRDESMEKDMLGASGGHVPVPLGSKGKKCKNCNKPAHQGECVEKAIRHHPAGSPRGGQFMAGDGGGSTHGGRIEADTQSGMFTAVSTNGQKKLFGSKQEAHRWLSDSARKDPLLFGPKPKNSGHALGKSATKSFADRVKKNYDESNPADSAILSTAGETHEMITQEQFDALQKRCEYLERALELNDAERGHCLSLSQTEQDGFLGMTKAQRTAEMARVDGLNPVVFTDSNGQTFRKNDDPRMVALAKQADDSRKEAVEVRKQAKLERIAKRTGEIGHLPAAKPEDRTLLVEAIEALPDDKRETAFAVLKSIDSAWAKAFQKAGTSAGADESADSMSKVEAIAKNLREKDTKLTEAQAFTKALETPEGRAAYQAHLESRTAR